MGGRHNARSTLISRLKSRFSSRERREAIGRNSSRTSSVASRIHLDVPSSDDHVAVALSHLDLELDTGVDTTISNSREKKASEDAGTRQDLRTKASQSPSGPRSEEIKPSLWAYAYKRVRQENVKLSREFEARLGVSTTSIGNDDDSDFYSKIEEVQQKALKDITTTRESRELSKTTAKIKRCFERGIAVIFGARDLIASAASANPYAALAWSGVSLLLPLLINPTQENEAALEGLAFIIHLMRVYGRQEQSSLPPTGDESEYKESIVTLYASILEYEATLLVHLHRNPVKGWATSVFYAGDWTKHAKSIQELDGRCRDIANVIARDEDRRWQDEILRQPRREEENRNLRMLYSNYEAAKNVNPERIAGTYPGCGKSVLAKYLVDRREETLTVNLEPPIVCYFFFKDGDLDRIDGAKALCAILHQLFMQAPRLYQYASNDFNKKSEKFLRDFNTLWEIFLTASKVLSISELICVLDALDECERGSKELIAKLVEFFSGPVSKDHIVPIVKFLVTSRPEYNIIREFRGLTKVRLRGEEESAQISQEINLVIDHKVEELEAQMDLAKSEGLCLQEKLKAVPQRTYLWLYLTFQSIEKQLELSKHEIMTITSTIPQSVDEAYTKILNKSPNKERARRLLHIILAAVTPLSLREINVAMAMNKSIKSFEEFDFWEPKTSADKIKNICGLFVTIVDSKVYLIHQTAREYLICPDSSSSLIPETSPLVEWRKSFNWRVSNFVLAEICIFYLQLGNFANEQFKLDDDDGRSSTLSNFTKQIRIDREINKEEYFKWAVVIKNQAETDSKTDIESEKKFEFKEELEPKDEFESEEATEPEEEVEFEREVDSKDAFQFRDDKVDLGESLIVNGKSYVFLSYAARYWAKHFKCAQSLAQPTLTATVAQITCCPLTHSSRIWRSIYNSQWNTELPAQASALILASWFGFLDVIKALLSNKRNDVNSQDSRGRTPLFYAIVTFQEEVVQLLLEQEDVQVNLLDDKERTPFFYAARLGFQYGIQLLLKRKELDVGLPNHKGMTPLAVAAYEGNKHVVKLLLERDDVKVDYQDDQGRTPLYSALDGGYKETAELLLERGANVNLVVDSGWTPLHLACFQGSIPLVKSLLDCRAEIDADYSKGTTPLHIASKHGPKTLVDLLLDHGAQIDAIDKNRNTPLYYVASKNTYGNTSLHIASRVGSEAIMEKLLRKGAQINAQNDRSKTPLHKAVLHEHKSAVDLLLREGADANLKTNRGNTPLHTVGQNEAIAKLLLERGAISDLQNQKGETPLSNAKKRGYMRIVKIMEKYGP
ncbi:MAG: hypothetical protein Q9167_003922 [Letrouitia subvulpina]